MSLILRALSKTVMNWNKPFYSKFLFKFSSKYVDFCYGDNNFDRQTNGEARVVEILAPSLGIMLDVGANVGDYAQSIHDLNPTTVIHAFEPDERAFTELSKRTFLISNNMAMGERPGTITLKRHKGKTVLNTVLDFHKSDEVVSTVQVKMDSVDSYCKINRIEKISFLKVDVEGFEFSVIKGAQDMLEKGAIDYIQFEFSGATAYAKVFLRDFIDLFEKNDYSLYRIKPRSIESIAYRPDQERFTLTNYIAVRNGVDAAALNVTHPTYLS